MGDIIYGTNNEFGFDYLRDNLRVRPEDQVQRSRYFAIIDEVDNILIDEARTPLIISGSTQESTENYYKADKVARQLKGGDQLRLDGTIAELMKQGWTREDARLKAEEDWDYVFSERDHSAKLTERGMHKALRLLGMEDIYAGDNLGMPHHIDNALRAHALYKKDHHYIVRDGQVLIVDEFTGRIMEGRRWSDGLHQAVEAKEHLRIKEESQTVATITFQNFFRLYDRLGGMTGTAMTEAKEFDRTYGLGIVSVPTNRPLRRHNYPDLIYGTAKEKFDAIVEHIAEVHATGRPILIGTVSIERSEIISALLKRRGVPHEVLNAKHHAREAQIVTGAGGFGQVTVATNMAGRGTDIVLGTQEVGDVLEHWQRWGLAPKKGLAPDAPEAERTEALRQAWVRHYLPDVDADYEEKTAGEWDRLLQRRWEETGLHPPTLSTRVADMGGLHIVGTERHEARRIDNQLRGRAGRQGDPGSSRFFLSLEDDTMRLFASEKVSGILRRIGLSEGVPIESGMVTRTVENAQKKVEERNYEIRKNLLEYDSVMNEQRQLVYDRRQSWVEGRDLRESMVGFCEDVIDARVRAAARAEDESGFDTGGLSAFMADNFLVEVRPAEIESARTGPDPEQALSDVLAGRLRAAYDAREHELGAEAMRTLEKLILLETLDRKWMDHLYEMDLLKEGIHLRGYAGQDPKIRYKREGYEIFEQLWQSLEEEVAGLILRVKPVERMDVEEQVEIQETVHEDFDAYADETSQIGRNIGEAARHADPIVNTVPKVGRNDPCPCGSGRKYKKCCGR
jgi:preprotein translocase subunit SecA